MGFLAHPPFTGLGHVLLPKATPSTASMCTTRMATSQTLGWYRGMGFFSLPAEVISSPKNPWNPHFDPFFQTVKSFPKLPKHLGVFPV